MRPSGMAPLARTTALLVLAVALAPACDVVVAQMGGDPFADWTPEGVGVVKSDLPYIQCGVCQRVAHKIIEALRQKKEKATKSKPVGELQIIELTEKICDRRTAEGGWILHTDMEEDGDRIKVRHRGHSYSFSAPAPSPTPASTPPWVRQGTNHPLQQGGGATGSCPLLSPKPRPWGQ